MRPSWEFIVGGAVLVALSMIPVSGGSAAGVPGIVDLASLAMYFDGAEFDHEMHVDFADDCSQCHHHTTGTGVTDKNCMKCHADSAGTEEVACTGCHAGEPFSAEYIREKESQLDLFHVDKPGLKAAYHLSCMGCHAEMDGPTGCEDCHSRTEAGDALYRTGAYAPEGKPAGSKH